MLITGSDLGFVAAAVQSWSLPHIHRRIGAKYEANKYVGACVVLILLAVAARGIEELVVHGYLLGKLILAWLGLELAYFLFNYRRYAECNALVEVPLDLKRVDIIKDRFLTLASCMPMKDFLSGWFQGADADTVLRGNVADFIAYGFYCRKLDELTPELQERVHAYVKEVEEAYGQPLQPGRNPGISFMAHLWEPLRALHTPLCVHLMSEIAVCIASMVLRLWGFRKHSYQGLGYWYLPGAATSPREPPSPNMSEGLARFMNSRYSIHHRGDSSSSLDTSLSTPSRRPLVFFHGVGFGIMPYLNFLWKLRQACPENPMIFMDIPHVALRAFRRAKNIDLLAAATTDILARHNHADASFVGHSFGSLCISRICQLFPEVVDSILLDSFVYKTISWTEAFATLDGLANAVRIIFSRDLIIAETFCRQFLWHALMLWPEDMPQKSVISVSAHDDLVPAKLVARHLQSVKSPAKVITHPTAAHGGIFLDNAYQNQLVASAKHVL